MKLKFVHTRNVAEFIATASKLQRVEAGVPGMGLIFGNRGFGKTSAAIYYTGQKENNAVYVRAKSDWSYGWMMEELCIELGVTPRRGAKAKYDDVVSSLVENPRLVVIDEANLIAPKLLETLRGINDTTHNPVLFIGHEGVVDKLRRMGPLFDRLLYMSEFKSLEIGDLERFAESCLEMDVEADVLGRLLKQTGGNFRKCVVALKGLENRAGLSRAEKITAAHLPKAKAA
jgi:DNA transposition AAA+ family ATPase